MADPNSHYKSTTCIFIMQRHDIKKCIGNPEHLTRSFSPKAVGLALSTNAICTPQKSQIRELQNRGNAAET